MKYQSWNDLKVLSQPSEALFYLTLTKRTVSTAKIMSSLFSRQFFKTKHTKKMVIRLIH